MIILSTKEVNKNGSEKHYILFVFWKTLWAWHRDGNVEVIRETLQKIKID